MNTVAVTVVGEDRPGIVAEVAGGIADLGGNLEDSSMTLLRGHFAMTLVASLDEVDRLPDRLAHLEDEGLAVAVLPVPQASGPELSNSQILSLHGSDRPGIVSQTTQLLADRGGNITDISTRLRHGIYVLTAEVQFPADADLVAISADIAALAESLGVQASLRPAEEDVL